MKRSLLIILSIFLAITVSAQDVSSALRQAQARFDSGNETGGIELVNKILAKYPDNKEAKDMLAKFNKVIKDREIEADWKIAQEENTFESYQTFRSKHSGSKYDDTASDNMAKKLADMFTVNSTYTDRTTAESYAKKAMTKDYVANKWKAAMDKKTSTSQTTSTYNSTYSNNSSSYTSDNTQTQEILSVSTKNKISSYFETDPEDRRVRFGLDLSGDIDGSFWAYGISTGLSVRFGSFENIVNGVIGLKYSNWQSSSSSWIGDDLVRQKHHVNALTMPVLLNINYFPAWDWGGYIGAGYEFNLAYSGVYKSPSVGSWIIQLGFGGRHIDFRVYFRPFPEPYFGTIEYVTAGTGLTYYF